MESNRRNTTRLASGSPGQACLASGSPRQARLAGLILRWYSRHGRQLPWRETRDPYRILVSETMLQQTQVARVLVKYPEFLRRFPSVRSLARAPRREVVMLWRGMGYNNRAVRLHLLAQTVLESHDGALPDDGDALGALPGVGRYTANALLSFAFGRSVPVVDVNVRRVLSRILWKMETFASVRDERTIWEAAEELLPARRAYDWNQALMDLGATICTARAPRCGECPVAPLCASCGTMRPPAPRPLKKERLFGGLPNRAYRGRIIEVLRAREGNMTVGAIGQRIRAGFSERDERWLTSLISGLERDGLITTAGMGPMITRRVALA
jgi:A/G-specific adenine glycosylase